MSMAGSRQAADPSSSQDGLSWLGIARLGLVQTALGAIVVLTTSTMNRVMVVEHMLPAMLPGILVALHYFVQLTRPRLGHESDRSGRRTPWIIGGMALLAAGGVTAAVATAWMASNVSAGVLLALVAFLAIGIGVGASGTSLLALLARQVGPQRRAAAGSIVWMMMILGFIITAGVAGHYLDPFSPQRLVLVTAVVAALAFVVAVVAVLGVEKDVRPAPATLAAAHGAVPFNAALREVWTDPKARQFTLFVFISMLAYSTQDLILEPFAGTVFGMTPGESTQLAGVQNAGVLLGMLTVALCGTLLARRSAGSLRLWTAGGCLASAAALGGLGVAGFAAPEWPLAASVFLLGTANGAFAVAAIASMMALAGAGSAGREGVRMGLWGAAQAIAFALGGFVGTAAIDLLRWLLDQPALAYSAVFTAEAALFLVAGRMALQIAAPAAPKHSVGPMTAPTLSGGRAS